MKRINLFLGIFIIFVFGAVSLLVTFMQYIGYNRNVNSAVSGVIESISEKYPEVTENEIFEILNKEGNVENNFLSKYGYEENSNIIKKNQKLMLAGLIGNALVLVFCGGILLIGFAVYQKKQNRKLNEIKEYIKAINNKDYSLNIEDNGEDELSKLRNELYKITVNLREVAELSKKEKENLSSSLADISHQLKTPLTSIRIMLDNIEENPEMEESVKNDFIKDIDRQVDWISSLVVSLLKLAKFDAGTIVMNREKISLQKLINNSLENLSVLSDIRNISIITNISEKDEFFGDYKWEVEAYTNIIKNSIEHSKENSKIYISSENNNFFLKIVIRDEGEGISKEDINHIFERFYKSKNSGESSIGIGLSLAKTVIEQDGGYIVAHSEMGKGTIFEVKYMK